MYLRWMEEYMRVFVPVRVFARQWLEFFKEFPPECGGALGIDNVIKQMGRPQPR